MHIKKKFKNLRLSVTKSGAVKAAPADTHTHFDHFNFRQKSSAMDRLSNRQVDGLSHVRLCF